MYCSVAHLRSMIVEVVGRPGWAKQVLDLAQEDIGSPGQSPMVSRKLYRLLKAMEPSYSQYDILISCFETVCHFLNAPNFMHGLIRQKTETYALANFKRYLDALERRVPNGVNLIVGSRADGSFDYDVVQVTIADYVTGQIGLTVEANPDAVWVFDPETLSPTRVATYFEARQKRVKCARLRDIESGNI